MTMMMHLNPERFLEDTDSRNVHKQMLEGTASSADVFKNLDKLRRSPEKPERFEEPEESEAPGMFEQGDCVDATVPAAAEPSPPKPRGPWLGPVPVVALSRYEQKLKDEEEAQLAAQPRPPRKAPAMPDLKPPAVAPPGGDFATDVEVTLEAEADVQIRYYTEHTAEIEPNDVGLTLGAAGSVGSSSTTASGAKVAAAVEMSGTAAVAAPLSSFEQPEGGVTLPLGLSPFNQVLYVANQYSTTSPPSPP